MPSMVVRTAGSTALWSPSQSDREADIFSSRSFSSCSHRSRWRFAHDAPRSSRRRRHDLQILTSLPCAPFAKRTEIRMLSATRKRHAHMLANQLATTVQNATDDGVQNEKSDKAVTA